MSKKEKKPNEEVKNNVEKLNKKMSEPKEITLEDNEVEKLKTIDFTIQKMQNAVGVACLNHHKLMKEASISVENEQKTYQKELEYIARRLKVDRKKVRGVDYNKKVLIVA
jgi:succinylarginine dihydrolase